MIELNWKIAELCGIILGDGHIHTTENRVTIVGSLEDENYYQNYVIPLFESLFNITPSLKFRKDSKSCYIYAQNKNMFNFLINDLGLKRGNKINAIIPKQIIKNPNLISHFLRGFFDTDGSLKFSKQTKFINYYPRIKLCCKKSDLAKTIHFLLNKLDFNFSIWEDNRKGKCIIHYEISGRDNLIKWMKVIGSSNPVHHTKFLLWKKQGYVTPRSSLNERSQILKIL